jgi:hypothetical protein
MTKFNDAHQERIMAVASTEPSPEGVIQESPERKSGEGCAA